MIRFSLFAAAAILIAGCASSTVGPEPAPSDTQQATHPVQIADSDIAAGQTIYVPVYSHIYHTTQSRVFNLTATLSIRNTDPESAIVLRWVRYYDSNGHLVRDYLESPIELDPMATIDYVVPEADESGGAGANFLIEWVASRPVTPPLAEAVMIRSANQQGISFVTRGVVTSER